MKYHGHVKMCNYRKLYLSKLYFEIHLYYLSLLKSYINLKPSRDLKLVFASLGICKSHVSHLLTCWLFVAEVEGASPDVGKKFTVG